MSNVEYLIIKWQNGMKLRNGELPTAPSVLCTRDQLATGHRILGIGHSAHACTGHARGVVSASVRMAADGRGAKQIL
jgi:hypothetical protein